MKLALILLLLVAACAPGKEPRFKEGDLVEFKGLPLRGRVRDVSAPGYDVTYWIRLPNGSIIRASEIELEPAK